MVINMDAKRRLEIIKEAMSSDGHINDLTKIIDLAEKAVAEEIFKAIEESEATGLEIHKVKGKIYKYPHKKKGYVTMKKIEELKKRFGVE